VGLDLTLVERAFTLVVVNPALDEFAETAALLHEIAEKLRLPPAWRVPSGTQPDRAQIPAHTLLLTAEGRRLSVADAGSD
jgi:hypothetical protein